VAHEISTLCAEVYVPGSGENTGAATAAVTDWLTRVPAGRDMLPSVSMT